MFFNPLFNDKKLMIRKKCFNKNYVDFNGTSIGVKSIMYIL